jgi:cysteine desulfurase
MKTIYLDNSATTPVRREVLKEALPYFSEVYGNPSSFHSTGLVAKKAIINARENITKILNCSDKELIFTGSGTESINLAIKGIALSSLIKNKGKAKGHFITQKTEHDAVLESFEWIEKLGFSVSYLNVDAMGLIDLEELKKTIRSDTLLVSIMYANNEVGTIQPLKKISKICHDKKVLLHTDACQGAEYLDIDVKKLGVDLMTINGSKIYAFKGTGLLYKKQGITLEPLIHGGGHENKLRAGTENTPGIIAMSKALELAQKEKIKESERLLKLRTHMIKRIQSEIVKTKLNGHPTKRLPNNVNFSFHGIEGESLLLMLNEKGIRVSTGSACSSQSLDPSHVLMAMGMRHGLSHSSTRFSIGKYTTKKEIDFTVNQLKKVVKRLREISPVWEE